MTKFRSKLKRKNGGKKVQKGQSSLSNPEVNKHRLKARSRFFSTNLQNKDPSSNGLTMEDVEKHDAIESFKIPNLQQDPMNALSGSLKDFSIKDDDDVFSNRTMSQATTFASQFTATSNVSFNKLIMNFQPNSLMHKEMIAILSALTEIIKEKGGNETNTEYFLALMETIENVKEDSDLHAALMLLNMGIKSVPEAVLRKKFNETAEVLLNLIARFAEKDNNILRIIISCLSVVLRAQEYSQWKLSSTTKFFDAILTFVTHAKPKIRKSAQHAVASILIGSCFVLPPKKKEDQDDDEELSIQEAPKIIHPAANRVAKFCVEQFKPEIINNNQTLLLHILTLLQSIIPSFNRDDIKNIAEHLLSIMTSGNILIRTSCFQTFFSLFDSKTNNNNMSSQIVGKLISALYEYRPDRLDYRQVLAWITVMKAAHIKLNSLNSNECIQATPKFFEIAINDLWLSDRNEVISGTSNALKEILEECIKPVCSSDNIPTGLCGSSIRIIISLLTKTLTAPFGATSNHILIICGILFESVGKHFGEELEEALTILGARYDDQSSQRVHIEHAVHSAITSINIERVLKCIPLTDSNGNMSVKRSWILPLLREGLQSSSIEYFYRNIIKLAYECYTKWQKFKETDKKAEAHIYELLCCQLWGLFPGFCRRPNDLHNFKLIARTLGDVLNKNPDLRPPILDGFRELLENFEKDEDKQILARYSENYLTRFFNIYVSKPTTSYEREIRESTFEVLKLYLKITPKETLDKLFDDAIKQMSLKAPGSHAYDSLFDIVEALALYQSCDKITELYKSYIVTTLIKDKKDVEMTEESKKKNKDINLRRRLKKSYKLLQGLLTSENDGCIDFVAAELNNIEKILSTTTYKVIEGTQVSRLSCINLVLEKKESIDINNKILKIAISEALAGFNNEAVMKDGIAYNLIRTIGKIYQENEKLNDFIDNVMVGLIGKDHQLISNTIFSLKFILQEFAENMSLDTIKFMLDQVLEFTVSNQRNEANSSLYFLATFTKLLPPPFVATHLGIIMKAITLMVDDCRRHSRQVLGYLLKKLCKRFTAEEIIKLVPGTDESLHKRLKVIKKQMARARRNQLNQMRNKSKKNDEDDSDDELLNIEKKTQTIDDILADSDSDMSDDETEKENTKSKKKNPETYIREDEDMIVDLADSNAFSKITTSKSNNQQLRLKTKQKDPNRGFKTAPDGRLIITDIEDEDTDSDDDDLTGYKEENKNEFDEDTDSENEKEGSSKKKIALNPYKAGGSGIHRPLAESVKSGVSNYSRISKASKATTRVPGSEYKAKKAGGDVKKKGKHEPYAYVQLSRNSLNRRKRKAAGSNFKNIAKKNKKKSKK
ncbi:hypothetical protein PVAND_001803 [Polypedilum vanderplanki]|uniref:Ribosomal RNA-processing protein 12-like conserved domain-containing protein n=1 Tax=Polypedilum vanderplanki TaxID=319348 RepID=A0A9J6BPC5_POLVA|nr:hypothetical protein PVAND_001803 [Polypedilum vanderplanki]